VVRKDIKTGDLQPEKKEELGKPRKTSTTMERAIHS
jgi:hypothetical protein